MKILLLSNAEPGGEWIAIQTLIKRLKIKNRNIKFYLVTLTKNDYLFKKTFEKIIYVKQKYYKKPLKYYRELFYQLREGASSIDKIFQEHVFDSVITIDYKLAISYLISQKKTNYIYYFHGLKNYFKNGLDNLNHYVIFRKFLEVLAWTFSKKMIVPSVQAKSYLINNYRFFLNNKKFDIVPNLIRNEFNNNYHLKNIEKEKNILYSGRLDPNKGIRNLLYAFIKFASKYPEFTLIIAYFGKPEIKIFSEIKLFIKNGYKIKFYKNLQTINLAKLYQTSYLAILPSSLEVSPLFLREALASNLPIFITDVGDVREASTNKFILKNNSSNSIYAKLIDYMQNSKMYRKEVLIQTKNWKKQYNEEEIVESFLKTIK